MSKSRVGLVVATVLLLLATPALATVESFDFTLGGDEGHQETFDAWYDNRPYLPYPMVKFITIDLIIYPQTTDPTPWEVELFVDHSTDGYDEDLTSPYIPPSVNQVEFSIGKRNSTGEQWPADIPVFYSTKIQFQPAYCSFHAEGYQVRVVGTYTHECSYDPDIDIPEPASLLLLGGGLLGLLGIVRKKSA